MAEYPDRLDTPDDGSEYPDRPGGDNGSSAAIDLVYNGAYPATSPYTDGDIVVGADGIVYLCVRPTSAAPTPWPGGPTVGAGADKNYVHTQVGLAAVWTVVHNLDKYVSVEVVDSGGSTVLPDVHYDSDDQLTLTFTNAVAGKAYVN